MRIYKDISLLPYNTFHLDVKCKLFIEYENEIELIKILEEYGLQRILPLGIGSNVLFCGDYNGVVLHSKISTFVVLNQTEKDVLVEVGGGYILDTLISKLVTIPLYGLENLSYIPGTVGAAVVQNVGAYGVEMKDVIEEVWAVNIQTRELKKFTVEDCCYAYRQSIFKTELNRQYIVTRVVLRLHKYPQYVLDYKGIREAIKGEISIKTVRDAIISTRKAKLPDIEEMGSAGSFFKNPIVRNEEYEHLKLNYPDAPYHLVHTDKECFYKLSAAWLIENSGLKGLQIGGASVYERQPLVIVNKNCATYLDIMNLANYIVEAVHTKTGIGLVPEVQYIS